MYNNEENNYENNNSYNTQGTGNNENTSNNENTGYNQNSGYSQNTDGYNQGAGNSQNTGSSQNTEFNQNNGFNQNTGYAQYSNTNNANNTDTDSQSTYRYSYVAGNSTNNSQTADEHQKKQKKQKKHNRFLDGHSATKTTWPKKFLSIVLSAAIFGVVAGSAMYGTYKLEKKYLGGSDNRNYTISTVSSNIGTTTDQLNTLGDANLSTSAMNVESVASAALPAMVALNGTTSVTSSSSSIFNWGGQQQYEASTSGTGIIVGKNDTELLMVTNAHVVDKVSNLKCVFIDNQSVNATVKGSKSDQDIAVVAVSLSDIPSDTLSKIAIAELADSDTITVGQQVVAIGNALGEGQSVTTGIISALDRSITVNNVTFSGLIMTDAAINSGNSGGALLNASGKVIAINFAKTSSDGVEGMAYSIPVSNVKDLISSLMSKQTRQKVSSDNAGYLGVAAIDVTSTYASMYGYPQGIMIRTVASGSAAEKAGLSAYDIIVGFDDQTITTMSGLQTTLQYYAAGEKVKIDYYHLEGSEYVLKSTEVTLGKKS
jgi:serine protease Do